MKRLLLGILTALSMVTALPVKADMVVPNQGLKYLKVTVRPFQLGFRLRGSSVRIDPNLLKPNQQVTINIPVQSTQGGVFTGTRSRYLGGARINFHIDHAIAPPTWFRYCASTSSSLEPQQDGTVALTYCVGNIPINAQPFTFKPRLIARYNGIGNLTEGWITHYPSSWDNGYSSNGSFRVLIGGEDNPVVTYPVFPNDIYGYSNTKTYIWKLQNQSPYPITVEYSNGRQIINGLFMEPYESTSGKFTLQPGQFADLPFKIGISSTSNISDTTFQSLVYFYTGTQRPF